MAGAHWQCNCRAGLPELHCPRQYCTLPHSIPAHWGLPADPRDALKRSARAAPAPAACRRPAWHRRHWSWRRWHQWRATALLPPPAHLHRSCRRCGVPGAGAHQRSTSRLHCCRALHAELSAAAPPHTHPCCCSPAPRTSAPAPTTPAPCGHPRQAAWRSGGGWRRPRCLPAACPWSLARGGRPCRRAAAESDQLLRPGDASHMARENKRHQAAPRPPRSRPLARRLALPPT